MTSLPDKRINAYRKDLADASLRGTVISERYVEPLIRQCVKGVLPLFLEPTPLSPQVSQVRYGEFLDVFETRDDGFAWVQNRADRYVGYIPSDDTLLEYIADLSRRVSVLHTFVYAEPDIKSAVRDQLTLGAFVQIHKQHEKFSELATGGYVFSDHILSTDESRTLDYVFTAGRLIATPYLWGGRTPLGIDCSGLVQLALDMAGIDAPRDSDQQCEFFGRPLENHWRDMAWVRGDLVFFKGHVGIMTGTDHMIHANATFMGVTVETLEDFMARNRQMEILAAGRPV